jgi:hypothetical protein
MKHYNTFAKGVNLFSKYFSLGMSYFCAFELGRFPTYSDPVEWWRYVPITSCIFFFYYNYLKVKVE